jgi:hypothetical protein
MLKNKLRCSLSTVASTVIRVPSAYSYNLVKGYKLGASFFFPPAGSTSENETQVRAECESTWLTDLVWAV